jgi:small conductance mechanosensitive channel
MEQTANYLNTGIDLAWRYGPNLVISIALLTGGLWIIRRITAGFSTFLNNRRVDESLRPFFTSLIDVMMKVALLLVVAGRLGFETTSFIAVFSALAFAIGLALQGSLGNFASGVLVLLFRPYKVGDMVKVENHQGLVTEIQIFNTLLQCPDGRKIIIPNGKMTEGAIENIGVDSPIRAEVILQVKDHTPMPLLREACESAIQACPHRLPEHPAFVEIAGFPRDALKVIVGCWTTGQHYWETFYWLHEAVKKNLDIAGIELSKEDFEEPGA